LALSMMLSIQRIGAGPAGRGSALEVQLAGRAPLADSEHRGTYEKLMAQVQKSPMPIRQLRGDVPPELAALLDRCWIRPASPPC
jgi:hypothetical protein